MLAQPRHQPRIQVRIPGLGSLGVDVPGTPASVLIPRGTVLPNLLPTIMSSMTSATTERPHRWSQRLLFDLAAIVIILTGGCALVMNKPHSSGSPNLWDDSTHRLTDAQAMAQVVDTAKQIVASANLQG
jgi:hypothetical protein